MKFGFVGSFGTTDQVLEMAVAAEEAGWDGFFTWDGISVEGMEVYDPWSLLGAIAVKTSRIRIGAMVFALARRRPWKVAREAMTIDHLSHGRLIMPVGLGATSDGGFMRIAGEPSDRKERAERLDETLAFLDQAWQGETFSFSGTHYQTTDLTFLPRPVQQPRIPIWVVGAYPSEKSMGRAIRWDGAIPSMRSDPFKEVTPEDAAEVKAWVDAHRTAQGPFDIVTEGRSQPDVASAERIGKLADAGFTWWIESRWEVATDTPESLLERIRQGPPRR